MEQSTGSDDYEVAPAPHIPELYSWDSPPPTSLPDVAPIRLPMPAPTATELPVVAPVPSFSPSAPAPVQQAPVQQPPVQQAPAPQPPAQAASARPGPAQAAPENPPPAFAWLGELTPQDDHTPTNHGILDLHVEAPVVDDSGRSALAIVALVAAVVIAPIGIVLGAVSGTMSRQRIGYFPTISKAAVIIGIIFSLLGAGGGVAYGLYAHQAAQQEAIRVSSQPMCAAIATKPGLLASPSLEWPGLSSTIAKYVTDTTAYAKFWTSTAKVAPKGIASQVKAIAAAAQGNVDRLSASRVVDTGQDVADMTTVASASTLPAWVAQYCH